MQLVSIMINIFFQMLFHISFIIMDEKLQQQNIISAYYLFKVAHTWIINAVVIKCITKKNKNVMKKNVN